MRQASFGPLSVRLAGGSDREGGGTGPLVVLMHGFGAPGGDLVPLWRELSVSRETRFAFPEAPLPLSFEGGLGLDDARAWWLIDVERFARAQANDDVERLIHEVPDGLAEARGMVMEMLALLEKHLG